MIERFETWTGGVVKAIPGRDLPPEVMTTARNTAFRYGQPTALTRRPGSYLAATTLPTGSYPVALIHKRLGLETTRPVDAYYALTSYGNVLELSPTYYGITLYPTTIFPAGVLATSSTTFGRRGGRPPTSATNLAPRMVVANDLLYVTSGFGYAARIDDRGAVPTGTMMGLPAPAGPPTVTTLSNQAAPALPRGIYDFYFTWYHVPTGLESSPSPVATVDLSASASNNFWFYVDDVLVPRPAYPEQHYLYLYLRARNTQSQPYRWTRTTMGFNAAGGGIDPGTGFPMAVYIVHQVDEAMLANEVIPMPLAHSQDPPPQHLIDLCWHGSRMFVTDGQLVYYSKLGQPEAFNTASGFERVGVGDSQTVTGLLPLAEHRLAIFKERSIYLLSGATPQEWSVSLVSAQFGAISPQAITTLDHVVYGWGLDGPWRWEPNTGPVSIAEAIVHPLVQDGQISATGAVLAGTDPIHHRVLFRVPTTTRWTVITYSAQAKVWESDGWDLGDVQAFVTWPWNGDLRSFFGLADSSVHAFTDGAIGQGTSAPLWSSTDLVYTVTSGATTTVLPVTPALPGYPPIRTWGPSEATIVDRATLAISYRAYTYTAGGSIVLTTPLAAAPAIGSLVLLDIPVATVATVATDAGLTAARKRWLWAYGEADAHPTATSSTLWVAFVADAETTPARIWTAAVNKATALRGRVARSGSLAQLQALWFQPLTLDGLALRSEPRHDRR